MIFLLQVSSPGQVLALTPDFAAIRRAADCRGVIVTAQADHADYDFVSRFFAPGVGIDEDPVTGSAHCCLGPYWSPRLGKKELIGFQASQRGGYVRVRVEPDRCHLLGQAVTIVRGELIV